jgi:RNA recognition motif-containing protein
MQHQPPQAFHSSNNGGEYHGGNVAPMRTLFVGDLSFFCNDEDLRSLFSSYGQVLSVEIKRGKATGDSLMHGFVEMDSEASAENALHHLRNQKFLGRRIRVSWGSGPSEEIQLFAQERDHWIQLHVSFVSRTVSVNR